MAAAAVPLNAPRPEEAREPAYGKDTFKGDIPKEYKLKRYYTAADIAAHNSWHDCWVSYFGNVYDLTPLLVESDSYYIGDNRGNFYYINSSGDFTSGKKGLFADAGSAIKVMSDDVNSHSGAYMLCQEREERGDSATCFGGRRYIVFCAVGKVGDPETEVEWQSGGPMKFCKGFVFNQGTSCSSGPNTSDWLFTKHPSTSDRSLATPIIDAAGHDISHWFDQNTGQPKTHVDPETGLEEIYCPWGRYIHVPPKGPESGWSTNYGTPWWEDRRYYIGSLTRRTRKVTMCNLLTKQKNTIEVPVEETVDEIQERYLTFNAHAKSYKWTRLGKPLNMKQTLEENGMKDETEEFMRLGVDPDEHIPVIHLHFLDDLTEA